jgi:hypothetical protein
MCKLPRQQRLCSNLTGFRSKAGVWERVFDSLTADPDNQYLMLDSTLVRVHQQAAGGKGGPGIRLWGVPEED